MREKINKNKLELIITALTLLSVTVIIIFMVSASSHVSAEPESSSHIPSLFHNDKPFAYSLPNSVVYLPLEIIDGVLYIPVDMLRYIDGIKIGNIDIDNFYVQYTNKNRFISFNYSNDTAFANFNEISCKLYKFKGYDYVPAEITAGALDLLYEYKSEYNSLRIKSTYAEKTFDDLLAKYIKQPLTAPTIFLETTSAPATRPLQITTEPAINKTTEPATIDKPPAVTTTEEPVSQSSTDNNLIITTTQPVITTEPTTPENTGEIENYLMFYDSSPFYTDDKINKIEEALQILKKENMRAVFFLSSEEIIENPDILRKIYLFGHEPGIKFNGDADYLMLEAEEVNSLIYSVLKHKTRFCMSDKNLEESQLSELEKNGYYLCESTVGDFDLSGVTNSKDMIDFMKQETVNIFLFDLYGEGYKNYVNLSAKAAEEKRYINFSYINNANIENINNKLKQIENY